MHYRIVEKPALMVAGLKKRLSQLTLSQEVGEMWSSVDYDQLQTALSQLPAGAPSGMLGVYDGMYEDDTTDYYIGAFVQAGESDSLQLLSIPPATWAVFELKGPMPTALAQGWERIYTEWFPTSGYEHAAGPEIEWYSAGDMSRDDYVSEIWIPVVKAGSLSPEQTVPLPAWVRPESSR